ncbi:MAG: hypothetical protein HKN50_03865 [Gammaproteobacteria bacterium]|nr:hypothetical protein [Gammaproteobacteria bacterium]
MKLTSLIVALAFLAATISPASAQTEDAGKGTQITVQSTQKPDGGLDINMDAQDSDEPGIHISIDSDSVGADEVKQKLKEVVDTLATKVKKKVDSDVTVEVGEVTEADLEELEQLKVLIEESDWDSDSDGISFGEMLVAVVAIIFSLGMPIIILLLVLLFSARKRKQRMELINGFISRDQPVPPELISDFNSGSGDPLRSGLQLVAVGAAISIALYLAGESNAAAFGLIPMGLGAARLMYWKLNQQQA